MIVSTVNVGRILRIGRLTKLCLSTGDELAGSGLLVNDALRVYSSRIEDVLPEDVVVSWPTDRGVRAPVGVGQSVALQFGYDRGILQLESRIVAKRLRPLPVLYIAREGEWSRSQLRLHVRLEVIIVPCETLLILDGASHAEAGAVIEALKKQLPQGTLIAATIRSLSAGGVRLALVKRLERGSIVSISFPLGEDRPTITALARVAWVGEDAPTTRRRRYKAGCQFLDLEAREQEIITKFIFAKQAELRRRGLL